MVERKFASFEQEILINGREAEQTPAERNPRASIDNLDLLPPAQRKLEGILQTLEEVAHDETIMVEVSNPLSSPSAAKLDQKVFARAKELHMAHRVPTHVMLTKLNVQLARQLGAQAIHAMGNPPIEGRENGRSVPVLLETLDGLEPSLLSNDIQHFRVSLEHALHTPKDMVLELVDGLAQRNRRIKSHHGRELYNAIGIPDTKGQGRPEEFIQLINLLGYSGRMDGMRLFVHLHKDNGEAIANAQAIIEQARNFGMTVIIEVAPDEVYTGERNGILTPNDLKTIDPNRTGKFPSSASKMMEGSSWRHGIKKYGYKAMEDMAIDSNGAGIHTDKKVKGIYGNGKGIPAPGLYGIMGKGNIEFIQTKINKTAPSEPEVIDAAAKLGREFSAQFGNLPQRYAIRLAKLATEKPEKVYKMAQSFGHPLTWLDRPLPDLSELYQELAYPDFKHSGLQGDSLSGFKYP